MSSPYYCPRCKVYDEGDENGMCSNCHGPLEAFMGDVVKGFSWDPYREYRIRTEGGKLIYLTDSRQEEPFYVRRMTLQPNGKVSEMYYILDQETVEFYAKNGKGYFYDEESNVGEFTYYNPINEENVRFRYTIYPERISNLNRKSGKGRIAASKGILTALVDRMRRTHVRR